MSIDEDVWGGGGSTSRGGGGSVSRPPSSPSGGSNDEEQILFPETSFLENCRSAFFFVYFNSFQFYYPYHEDHLRAQGEDLRLEIYQHYSQLHFPFEKYSTCLFFQLLTFLKQKKST